MLLITCPYCGDSRDESDFTYGGEAHIKRPLDPDALTDQEWADYLFMRTNTKGYFREMWNCSSGCRRWFNAERNTVTNHFRSFYRIGEQPPVPDTEVNNG
ncbi:MAG: sarcosine oxidase subunit delta [Pseudomonadota bacterium]